MVYHKPLSKKFFLRRGDVKIPTIGVQVSDEVNTQVQAHMKRLGIRAKYDLCLIALMEYFENHEEELEEFRKKYGDLV